MVVLIRRTLVTLMLAFAACGDDSGHGGSAPILTGQLIGGSGSYPGAVAGVHFRSRSQSGFTDDSGTFTYVDGESVTFSVADVSFRAAQGAPTISPWQLAADAECEQSVELERLLVLLHSLDLDGDPDNGLGLVEVDAAAPSRLLATFSDADVAALVSALIPGRSPVDTSTAVDRFITQMDGEVWEQIGIDEFPLLTGLVRSQGLTTDGSSWFFSWRLGLERTDFDLRRRVKPNHDHPTRHRAPRRQPYRRHRLLERHALRPDRGRHGVPASPPRAVRPRDLHSDLDPSAF